MAIVIQELVGEYYDNYYYPHISGVAQSYNYYPVAHMKPEEGFSVCAVGLGFYIVDGGKAYRFSPHYPKVDIMSPKDQIGSSQTNFCRRLHETRCKLQTRRRTCGIDTPPDFRSRKTQNVASLCVGLQLRKRPHRTRTIHSRSSNHQFCGYSKIRLHAVGGNSFPYAQYRSGSYGYASGN